MPDPVETNPELYSVVFENDRVRVLRYYDRPGEQTQPHGHPDSVMVTLSAFERRLEYDGQHVEVSIPAGEIRWLDAQEHCGSNIGQTDTETVFIELKEPAPAPARESRLGPQD